MSAKSPRFRLLLPLLLALTAAAPPPAPPPPPPEALEPAEFPLDFREMCPYEARLCADYDALNAELDGEAGRKLGVERVSSLNDKLIGVVQRSDSVIFLNAGKLKIEEMKIAASIYGGLYTLREKVNKASLDSAPGEVTRLYADLSAEESRADKLMADLNASVLSNAAQESVYARLDALNADATRTWREVKAFSLNVDRLGTPIESKAEGKMGAPGALVSEFVNPMQARVAGLRDRLAKIKRAAEAGGPARTAREAAAHDASKAVGARLAAKGLDRDVFERRDLEDPAAAGLAARPPPAEPGPPSSMGGPPRPMPSGVDFDPNHVNLTVSPKTLLDNRPPPEIERPTTPLPPRTWWQKVTGASPLYGGGVFTEKDKDGKKVTVVMDAFPKETSRIAALREKGRTETVGDPGGRAQYVFRQMGGTCALASQAQMYAEAHGIKPTRAAMRKIEDEFFAKARETAQFNGSAADPKQRWEGGGTPDENLGNMLDTPVKKHYLAKDEELLAAVSRGKMVMIAANTGLLWNDKRHLSGGHAVVVTGAEVDKDGALLGYYINDTGTDEAARFVSAKQFMPAWRDRGSIFIEPL